MKEISNILQLDRSKIYNYTDYLSWKLEERVELIKGKILICRRYFTLYLNPPQFSGLRDSTLCFVVLLVGYVAQALNF